MNAETNPFDRYNTQASIIHFLWLSVTLRGKRRTVPLQRPFAWAIVRATDDFKGAIVLGVVERTISSLNKELYRMSKLPCTRKSRA
jgi:hypothetical protein